MESQWYYFPGQSPSNTKVSDRAHALHITRDSWGNITQHLDRKKRIQEAINKEQAHKEALKQGSEAMTKEWPNSVQNLRLRKEEERRNRFEDKRKEDKMELFYKMRTEQEVLRKQYVDKVKKEVFISHGPSRELTSALILSETLYEREKQKEFNNRIKKHNEEVKKKFDADILAADTKDKQEENEKKIKKLEEERRLGALLKKQITENREFQATKYREHIETETADRIKESKEEELIKQFEFDEKIRKRNEFAAETKKGLLEERQRQKVLSKENDEMEKATEFYSEAKKHIDCMMKSKEKQMREEGVKQRDELANKVGAIQATLDAAEDERIAKVVAERDEVEKSKLEAKAASQAQAVRERKEDIKQYFQKVEQEKEITNEMNKWELLNRIKTAEAMKQYDEESRKAKWAKILEYRKDLLEQMADDKVIRKQEKEIDDIMSHVSYDEADKMFFDYANEVMELAKSKNRPLYPIEKVITEYKTANKLSDKRRSRCYAK